MTANCSMNQPIALCCMVIFLALGQQSNAAQNSNPNNQGADHTSDQVSDFITSAAHQIALDLVGAIIQIEKLNPDSTTLYMQPPKDIFGAKLGHHLNTAGYTIELTESNQHPFYVEYFITCLLYTSPSPRDATLSRMPSSA